MFVHLNKQRFTLMFGEKRLVFFVDFEVVINDDALPLMIAAEPDSIGFIVNNSFFVFEQSGDKPLCFIT